LIYKGSGWLGNAIGYPKLLLAIVSFISDCENILIYNRLYNRQYPAGMWDGGLV